MKIIVKRRDETAEVTIDTRDCTHVYAIKEAFRTAMEIDGFPKSTIDDVLSESETAKLKINEAIDAAFDDD